jgi:hypothetical protein
MQTLSGVWNSIQKWLLPPLEEEIGELSRSDRQFVRVVELCDLPSHLGPYCWQGTGRRRRSRLCLLKAFVAKSVYHIAERKSLIERMHADPKLRRLCGWETRAEIPSEPTFCRAFAEFAAGQLPQKLHEAMIKRHAGPKLAGHVSRDSTPIGVREKPVRKPKVEKKPGKRGRPRKGEQRHKAPRRLELQPERTLAENLADLPTACDVGTKKNSKGRKMSWVGYKLHIDSIDGDIPVSCILTSASVHDSQVAIPLAQMTAERIANCYDLMDSAYDAPEIHAFCRALGHVPIIDHNPRRNGQKRPFAPATAVRYNERSTAERVNSNLKDNHVPERIRVRGDVKVMAELMFGILALTANQLYNLLL